MRDKYEKLLSPIKVGSTTLKNRIVKVGAGTTLWSKEGYVTEGVEAVYEKIAAGGAGLVIVDVVNFMEPSPFITLGGAWSDDFIPGLTRLASKIHDHDCKTIIQIHNTGPSDKLDPIGPSDMTADELPWLPSAGYQPTRGLTLEEIEDCKRKYIDAAERVQKAGFDGIEVHAAHGYLLQSFFSRIWNKRTDQYGADTIENRTRLAREIVAGVRERCGQEFLISLRLNGEEYGAGQLGMTIEESTQIAKAMEGSGIDMISVSGFGYGKVPSTTAYLPSDYFPYPEPDDFMKPYVERFKSQGVLVPPAKAIHDAVSLPVLAVGRMDENIGEEILEQGKADLIGFNRQLWADPEFPNKLMEGRYEDRVFCMRCGTCEGTKNRRCRANPAYGRYDRDIVPTKEAKRVLVVGGGAAGMEAARVASLRGHQVTLCEKESKLGGHMPLAVMVKGVEFDNIPPFINYLTKQIEKLPIEVRLNTEVTPSFVEQIKPDVLVLATGGRYPKVDIPGIGGRNVMTVDALLAMSSLPMKVFGASALNKLTSVVLPGVGRDVVVIGGQITGLQGALFFKKRGRSVTVVEESDKVGFGMPSRYLGRTLPWLKKNGVEVLSEAKVEEITRKGVTVTTKEGNRRFLACDTVVVLPMVEHDAEFASQFAKSAPQIYVANTCSGEGCGMIVDAMAEGRRIGVSI